MFVLLGSYFSSLGSRLVKTWNRNLAYGAQRTWHLVSFFVLLRDTPILERGNSWGIFQAGLRLAAPIVWVRL